MFSVVFRARFLAALGMTVIRVVLTQALRGFEPPSGTLFKRLCPRVAHGIEPTLRGWRVARPHRGGTLLPQELSS